MNFFGKQTPSFCGIIIILAVSFSAVGAIIWQYQKTEEQCGFRYDTFLLKIPSKEALREDNIIASRYPGKEDESINSPEKILEEFLKSRIEKKDKKLALSFLAQEAAERFSQQGIYLELINDNFKGFEILSRKDMSAGSTRFLVRILGKSPVYDVVEAITIVAAGQGYLISKIELAG